jgi:hypothetical protein
VRVNYYIKELYGVPDQPVWLSPLSKFCTEGNPWMFEHPALNMVLELKWARLRNYFLAGHLYYFLLLLLFMIGFTQAASDDETGCTPGAM